MKHSIVYGLFGLCLIFITVQACRNPQELTEARYFSNGQALYKKRCLNCHGDQGKGFEQLYPGLAGSEMIKTRAGLACLIRFGSPEHAHPGRLAMPANTDLTPIDIAYLIQYISNSFGNEQAFYTLEQVQSDLQKCE